MHDVKVAQRRVDWHQTIDGARSKLNAAYPQTKT
jgi:hypothetical protein